MKINQSQLSHVKSPSTDIAAAQSKVLLERMALSLVSMGR